MLEDKTNFDADGFLDEVLMEEPAYVLPHNFAAAVADKVNRRFVWGQYIREFLVYLAAIAGIIVVSAAMVFVWFEADWKEWLDFFLGNLALVASINILIIFILFADRVLLRYFMYKSSAE